MSRLYPGMLTQALGLPKDAVARIPAAEVYIRQGDVIGRDSAEARAVTFWIRRGRIVFRSWPGSPA